MSTFQSPVEAMQKIDTSRDKITQLLAEDLSSVPSQEHSIDLWLEEFAHDKTKKLTKDELIRHEMIITDAEIYLNFQTCPD
ncbi:MAG: hypothetical protein MK132_25920 [Lentisphaerales bacterium]|nr:hypothetical protein [Lentisphaerales bacterium]